MELISNEHNDTISIKDACQIDPAKKMKTTALLRKGYRGDKVHNRGAWKVKALS